MKLTYQTGTATLIQFLVLSLFTLASQVDSIVTTCRKDGSNCISNLITSIILYILVAVALGTIWLIGYSAQQRRSRRLAQLLICVEGLIFLIALLSIKVSLRQNKSILGLGTSFGVAILAVWVIILAFRLMRSGGKRITARPRARRRPVHPNNPDSEL